MCTRIWWVRPVSSFTRTRSQVSNRATCSAWLRAARPVANTAIRLRSLGCLASGASMSMGRLRCPHTSAAYSRSMRRCPMARDRVRCTASVLATIIRPDVSLSSLCTMPGRPSAPLDKLVPRATSALSSVSSQCPGAGWTTKPAGLSSTRIASSS